MGPTPVARFRDVVVIGGGCYGTFYAGQLAKALERGRLECRSVLVVDRDPACRAVAELPPGPAFRLVTREWGDFLDAFLDHDPPPPTAPDDAIVPSPLMPHLMAEWLGRRAGRLLPGGVGVGVAEPLVGTPYDVLAPDGTRYVSHADWLCPTHCIEPLTCPVIRGPRTWEMSETIDAWVRRRNERAGGGAPLLGPALFVTRHRTFGVGMFDAGEVRAAAAGLDDALRRLPADLAVATISACHGAVSVLRLRPAGSRDTAPVASPG